MSSTSRRQARGSHRTGCESVAAERPTDTPAEVVDDRAASRISLGKLVTLISSGSTPLGGSSNYSESGEVMLIRSQNVRMRELVLDDVAYVSRRMADGMARTYLQRGDVLLNITGASIGRTALFDLSIPANVNQHVCVIRPKPASLDRRYLVSFLASPVMQQHIMSQQNGGTRQALTFSQIANFQVPLPPLSEQRRIADILDKTDAIRRKRKEAIALTEQLLRSAFLDMVGPAAKDYSKWPVKTIESLAAQVPNAMRTGPFGSDLRHSEFVDEGIAVLGIDNAVQNRFAWGERRFITKEKFEGLRRYTVRPRDVIITIMGTTGRSAVVPDDIPTAITTKHLATITLDPELTDPEFVSQALFRHPAALRQIAATSRGAIMSGLNLGLIRTLRIPLPPIERQREFAEITHRVRALATRVSKEDATDYLFKSLVARAFSGGLKA